MPIDLFRAVPFWVRIAVIIALILVTILLISSHSATLVPVSQITPQRLAQLQDEEETLNLAVEFGFDPMIVQIVRMLSTDAIKTHACACATWRFVKTERDLTYLVLSVIQVESGGNFRAYNPGGPAYGLTQLLLSTARQYDKNVQSADLLTIPKNLKIAMDHFVGLLEKYRGNYTLAVLSWNRGSTAVDRSIAIGESPENGYARTLFLQAAMRNATR